MKQKEIDTLKQMLEEYRKYKKNAISREYDAYYSGATNAISRAIRKLTT